MENLALILRRLREGKKLPLREVSSALKIDQAIISKIERSQRRATPDQLKKLAAYYQVTLESLMEQWLSDEIAHILDGQQNALQVLDIARQKVIHHATENFDREWVFHNIYDFFRKTSYRKVWVYGPSATGDDIFARSLTVLAELSPEQNPPKEPQVKVMKQKLERLTRLNISISIKKYGDPIPKDIDRSGLILIWEKPR